VAYIMGVPGADDVMLNYQSTSFHDALYLRSLLGLKRAPEFEEWLQKMGITTRRANCSPSRRVTRCWDTRSSRRFGPQAKKRQCSCA
jgi:ethanolamine ammonia-lyase large subunit